MEEIKPTLPQEPPEVVVKSDEQYAYGFVMEVLTRGLYPDKLHVVREYIQNGFDAILELRRKGFGVEDTRIELKVSPPSLFIFDNGVGMDAQRMAEYRYVGYSRKLTAESVGFRGIGKLSGISAAEKIIVTTSPLGIPEQHKLIIDAEAMLQHVERLKARGENIALNQLIQQYTSLETTQEDPNAHYTQIELYKVRSDSLVLLDETRLAEYLSLTAPIDFDPTFQHGAQIDQELREYVTDYETAPIFVGENQVFKPFLPNAKPPQWIFVWDEGNPANPNPLAFCWYCENMDKGQFPDELRRGLFYRVKNFAVGDNQLPRISLWRSSPERSFYFFGEVHVCDAGVIPSADRTNFEQNSSRERLYTKASEAISRSLNRIAGKSSDTRRAIDFVQQAEATILHIQEEATVGAIPTELKVPRIVAISKAVENVQKRIQNAPEEFQERGRKAIEQGGSLISQIDQGKPTDSQKPSVIYDIKDELKLSDEARWVYETIISVLRTEFEGSLKQYERLISEIHKQMRGKGE